MKNKGQEGGFKYLLIWFIYLYLWQKQTVWSSLQRRTEGDTSQCLWWTRLIMNKEWQRTPWRGLKLQFCKYSCDARTLGSGEALCCILIEMSEVIWLWSNQRPLNDQLFNAAVTTLEETDRLDLLTCCPADQQQSVFSLLFHSWLMTARPTPITHRAPCQSSSLTNQVQPDTLIKTNCGSWEEPADKHELMLRLGFHF